MSLSSTSGTSALKAQLSEALGANEQRYWETFHFFLHGQLSRVEFEDTVRECLDSPQLSESIVRSYIRARMLSSRIYSSAA
jgi:hypothetical protein